jgi:hypothetical protein
MKIKFEYNGVIRKEEVGQMSFDDLKCELGYLFDLPEDNVGIEVKDEDGDWVRVCVFFFPLVRLSVLFLFIRILMFLWLSVRTLLQSPSALHPRATAETRSQNVGSSTLQPRTRWRMYSKSPPDRRVL